MPVLLTILAAIALSMIAYEDWRSRSVYWFWFPVLAIAGLVMSLIELRGTAPLFRNLLLNLAFLTVQLAVLKVYFFMRNRKNAGIIDKRIGSGDLLFLAAAGFFFSPLNFILFYIGSLLFTIAAWSMYTGFKKTGPPTMPLAGLQSVFFIACLLISLVSNYSLLNDDWLIQKLGG